MGAKAMATAAGTAVLVYLVLSGRLSAAGEDAGEERRLISSAVSAAAEAREAARRRRRGDEEKEKEKEKEGKGGRRRRRGPRWPERAPASWGEAAAVAARTVRFTYAETLGKWPLGELAFGIKYYMRQQL